MTEGLADRRIVVGVDGSTVCLAALRWAMREATLRGAIVHAVLAWEAGTHRLASYATMTCAARVRSDRMAVADVLRRTVRQVAGRHGRLPPVSVTAELAEGLAARVLLDRAAGAEMLVLGRTLPAVDRGVGPIIRACLRSAPCPVVIIGVPEAVSLLPEQARRRRERMPAGSES
jgi:nucleotide-binding universal stress UspA family protein